MTRLSWIQVACASALAGAAGLGGCKSDSSTRTNEPSPGAYRGDVDASNEHTYWNPCIRPVQRGPAPVADQPSADVTTAQWPNETREALRRLEAKYGPPTEVTKEFVAWRNNAPFLCTKVYREEIPHDFPMPHMDFIEQTISLQVPAEKVADLAMFDGSLIVDRTRGTVSARCDSQEHNVLALNLAYDVLQGKTSPSDARELLARSAEALKRGQPDPYAMQLHFHPVMTPLGDRDKSTVRVDPSETIYRGDDARAEQPASKVR